MVAADAGPMQIQLWEGAVSRCAEVVRQSTTDDGGSWKGDESARLVRIRGLRNGEKRGLRNGKAWRD